MICCRRDYGEKCIYNLNQNKLPILTNGDIIMGWISRSLSCFAHNHQPSTMDPMERAEVETKRKAMVARVLQPGLLTRFVGFGYFSARISPRKINGWNLKITHFEKENHLNQTIIFSFHVNLLGCSSRFFQVFVFLHLWIMKIILAGHVVNSRLQLLIKSI